MGLTENDGLEWITYPHSQLVWARGPDNAAQLVLEEWAQTDIALTQVLSLRHYRLGRRMLKGDDYDPGWDYEYGAIEEAHEEWEIEKEPGR